MATWKRCISFTLSLMMLLSIACVTVVSASPSEETILANQERANEAYNTMLEAFAQSPATYSSSNASLYPDAYAGSYLDENGNLVVMLTENVPHQRQLICQAAGSSQITFQSASYAMNDLEGSINQWRYEKEHGASTVLEDCVTAMLLDEDNRVEIGIVDMTPAKIQQFREEVFDAPWLVFADKDGPPIQDGTIMAGGAVSIGTTYSVAFPCKRTVSGATQYGFVTAAHGTYTGQAVSAGGQSIGTIAVRKYGGNTDAAFVRITNSNWSASYMIQCSSQTLTKTFVNPAVNTTVYKCGNGSGHKAGTVKSTSVSFFAEDGTAMTGLTSATYNRAKGDSGGIVYNGSRQICGVHHGGDDTYAFFTKSTYVRDNLGVSLY